MFFGDKCIPEVIKTCTTFTVKSTLARILK